jgi:hypothetical protein
MTARVLHPLSSETREEIEGLLNANSIGEPVFGQFSKSSSIEEVRFNAEQNCELLGELTQDINKILDEELAAMAARGTIFDDNDNDNDEEDDEEGDYEENDEEDEEYGDDDEEESDANGSGSGSAVDTCPFGHTNAPGSVNTPIVFPAAPAQQLSTPSTSFVVTTGASAASAATGAGAVYSNPRQCTNGSGCSVNRRVINGTGTDADIAHCQKFMHPPRACMNGNGCSVLRRVNNGAGTDADIKHCQTFGHPDEHGVLRTL